MENDRVLLEAISKRLIAIQSTCDKARTDINKILKETAELSSIVQEAIALIPSDNEILLNADIIASGTSKRTRDKARSVMDIISDVSKEQQGPASREVVLSRAEELGIERAKTEKIIDRLIRDGDAMVSSPGVLVLTDLKRDISFQRFSKEKTNNIMNLIGEISREHKGLAPINAIVKKAEEQKIDGAEAEQIIERLRRDGDVIEQRPGMLRLL
jgi:DNA replicative helicase MCM subunit Mcm2 (Cdc46/Mcm family)